MSAFALHNIISSLITFAKLKDIEMTFNGIRRKLNATSFVRVLFLCFEGKATAKMKLHLQQSST